METPPKWLSNGYVVLFASLPWCFELGFDTWHLTLPSEPLIGFLGIGLGWVFLQKWQALRAIFFKNIFLQISFAYLVWSAVCAYFSSLPIVSWKYWVVEAAHWWVFALGISTWPGLWRKAFPWLAFSMTGLAVYTLAHHAQYDFRADQAILAPMPFFPHHNMWAAAVAMVLFLFWPSDSIRPSRYFALSILLAALVFSNCRAAWLSVLTASLAWGFLFFGNGGRLFLTLALLVGGFFGGGKISQSLMQDVSMQERINRWQCVARMAWERPVAGFGPGTYQFQYLDFQKPEEMTRLSVREPIAGHYPYTYGRGGGAHSEYLRALAETGWPGFFIWIALVIVTLWTGFSGSLQLPGSLLPLVIPLALLTFFTHALVNDFLHDGRLAALVWGGMAVLFAERKK